MVYSKVCTKIDKLFNNYGLGRLIDEPKKITGGLMHTMYQVATENKKYAVKELNPAIMKRAGVVDSMVNSERVAKAFENIVPAITAIQFNDNPLLMLDEHYYMIFEWIDGTSIFPPNINPENCSKMGMLLGKMHSSNILLSNINKENHEAEMYDWDKYLLLGQETNAEWVQELSESIDDFKKCNEELCEACNLLSENLVLSHRDLDPKNVMWQENNPYFIDWEAAGYVNPHQELLELLNYWADNGAGELVKENFDALFNGYISIIGKCDANWDIVLVSGFSGMLGWLNYSFKRSLGIESTSLEEKNLGTKEVFSTIKALRQYSQNIVKIKSWLES